MRGAEGMVGWSEQGSEKESNSSEEEKINFDPLNLQFNVYLNPKYHGKSDRENTSTHEVHHVTIMFTDALTLKRIRVANKAQNGLKSQHDLTPNNVDLTKTLETMLNYNYKL